LSEAIMADDDVAVTIEEETKAPPNGAGAGETGQSAADDLQAQFADLKASRARAEDERAAALRRAQAAEAEVARAQREVATVRTEAVERQGESIDSGITAATEAITAAKKEIKSAGEAGNYEALADAQDRLARASARLERLTERKAEVDIRKAEAARPVRDEPRPAPTADPVETALADMAQSAPRSADWLRTHREFMTDAKKNAKVRAAHFDAVADGIAPESDEYFEFIETRVGLRKAPEPAADPEKPVAVKPHARRAPVAPVAAGGGVNGHGGTTVRLSKAQALAATDGTHVWNYDDPTGKGRWKKGEPIGIQEMARRVKAQTEQGLYDPNNIAV